MLADFRERLENWGKIYEYRLADILARFDSYEHERRESELKARRKALLETEGNSDLE